MNSTAVKNLFKKLSSLGLESLETLNLRNRDSFTDDISDLCTALLALKGEASSITIAEELMATYHGANAAEKLAFFQYLLEAQAANLEAVDAAVAAFRASRDQQDLQKLAKAIEPPRQDLFRALNMAPNGTQALVDMREDLLLLLPAHPELKPVDHDLLGLFRSWFNRGFLELRRIDWQTPAVVLEKLIEYESVHEIKGWPDLRRRLEDDRRCFGFFHPVIPDVPLIFVEVALTRGISRNVDELLTQPPPRSGAGRFNTAIFYSINNCLAGLRGVSFGNFLIKQVIENVAADMPQVKHYSTLSPVPGFLRWLGGNLTALDFVDEQTRQEVHTLLESPDKQGVLDNTPNLEVMLPRLCAWYLLKAGSRGKPADAVARFHLGNGARLEAINWMADTSGNGLEQSAGIMVNYLYDRASMMRNHERYEQLNELAASNEVNKLLPKENGRKDKARQEESEGTPKLASLPKPG